MKSFKVQGYTSGIQNKIPAETIADDAAQDSLGWVTEDGSISLCGGRERIGSDGSQGGIFGQIFAPKKDGTAVHFRKTNTKIQYFDGTTWQDTITGLTAGAEYTFSPYVSLAGAYLYATGVDGLFKIATANPGSYKNMFDEAKNYKGYSIINEQRMFLWNRSNGNPDRMGVYISKIDPQGTNYTTVSNEVLGASGNTTYSGTLAQATGNRFVFGVTITGTTGAGLETFTDTYAGTLTGSLGGIGTINYATGTYSVTFNNTVTSGNVEADYQYEDSNSGGVTDFTFSSPRVAGEGDIISQEYLGEPIQSIHVFEGRYYSFKNTCVYELDLTDDDTNATNIVYRVDIGIPSLRAAISTGKGIVYMDTGNPNKPFLSMLTRNPIGGNLEPVNLCPLFRWEDYVFDNCVIDTYGENILVSAKTQGADENDIVFLINARDKYAVDIIPYGVNTFAKSGGYLYGGDSFSDTIYKLFSGFDDLTLPINNYWVSKDQTYKSENLKKFRFLRFKGLIDPQQYIEVYASFDRGDFQLLGTIRGDGDYVDYSNAVVIGGNEIGNLVGGDGEAVGYPFIMEMRTRVPKFRTRAIKLVAGTIGFAQINWIEDHDVLVFEQRLPRRFRIKQHVSLDGTQTNLDTFAD